MKKTITVAIAAICLLATNFTANAQGGKVIRGKSSGIDVSKEMKIRVGDLLNQPLQNTKLGQVSGTIAMPDAGEWSSRIGNLFTDYIWRLEEMGTSYPANPDRQSPEKSTCFREGGFVNLYYKDLEIRFDSTDKKNIKYKIYNVPLTNVSLDTYGAGGGRYLHGYVINLVPKPNVRPLLANGNYIVLTGAFSNNIPACVTPDYPAYSFFKVEAPNLNVVQNIYLSLNISPNF